MLKKILFLLTLIPGIICAADRPADDPEDFGGKLRPESFRGIFPPEVKTVAVVSPASLPATAPAAEAVKLLREAGYTVRVYPHAFAPAGKKKFSSYPVEKRAADFYAAWNDPENDLILCSRGGSGSDELIQHLDWNRLKKRQDLYFMGFSDITLLHCALSSRGYGRCLPGPTLRNLTGLHPDILPQIRDMLNGRQVGPIKLETLIPGDCSGLPFAGLLNRLEIAHRNGNIPSLRGRIIFIENVRRNPELIRQFLNSMLERNFFDGAAAVVFCHFTRCGTPEEIDALLKEFAPKLKVPVFKGFPFGHHPRNLAIDLSRKAVIRNGEIVFEATRQK